MARMGFEVHEKKSSDAETGEVGVVGVAEGHSSNTYSVCGLSGRVTAGAFLRSVGSPPPGWYPGREVELFGRRAIVVALADRKDGWHDS